MVYIVNSLYPDGVGGHYVVNSVGYSEFTTYRSTPPQSMRAFEQDNLEIDSDMDSA